MTIEFLKPGDLRFFHVSAWHEEEECNVDLLYDRDQGCLELDQLPGLRSSESYRRYRELSYGEFVYFGILQAEQPVYRPVVVKSPRVLDAPDAQKYSGKYAIPIVQLKGLSIRGYHCLYRAGLHYVGDLVKMPGDDWLRVRNLGRNMLEEIATAVSNLGLAINMPSRPDTIERTNASTGQVLLPEDKPNTAFEEQHPVVEKVRAINKNREIPLLELGLPQHIQFALLQRGVETAGDIADLTPFVWKQMKQLKQNDQTLVAEKLKELGLRIKK